MRKSIVILLLLILVGCGHVPVTTMYKLRNFDPLTIDPAAIEIAVSLPGSIHLTKDNFRIVLGGSSKLHENSILENFRLVEIANYAGSRKAGLLPAPGLHYQIFSIAPLDIERFNATRTTVGQWKLSDNAGTTGKFNVDITGCIDGILLPGPLLAATWLKPGPDARFIRLTNNIDLRKINDQRVLAEDIERDCY
ncbi:MAG: hypothetical protein JKY49_17475 [Cohaesibacteraceae bacterium]|nr:hypothetical protein [Cohaesibacteraceae bacterium]MBL4876280.1 hypothetical protein [Cohaesibacteraceae bacterium]